MVRDLGLKVYVPARKSLLTEAMVAKRLQFCTNYGHWSDHVAGEGVCWLDPSQEEI